MTNDTGKRVSIRTILAIAVVALLALIGGTLLGSRAPDGVVAPDSSAMGARTGSGQRLVLLTLTPHVRAAETAAKLFEKETGAVFQVKVVNYEAVGETILKDHASNSPQIDVFEMHYADLAMLVAKGAVMDLTRYIEENADVIRPDDFIPGLYDHYTSYQGKRWALPNDADTHVLFYRKSLLAKYGLRPPDTWDDYATIARVITERERANGIYGSAIMARDVPMMIVSSFMNRLAAYGGELMDEQRHPEVNSPEAVTALEAMVEHAKYALPTPLETDFDVSRLAFLSGRVAMVEQWTDIGVMAEDPTQSTIRGDWGVVPMPKGKGPKARHASSLNGGYAVAISSTTKEPEIAKAYVRFVSRRDTMLTLNRVNGGFDPARPSILGSPEFERFAPQVSAIERTAFSNPMIAWPKVPQTPALMIALTDHLVHALEHQETPRQALNATQAEWQKILSHDE
ncbi:sugar ABC transporter substrate-binding protein [Pendulispora rubella]|uniref:Sugar ABC transporter substrate-binding protein n=1 Tax=Pendulispora rubella TaxID=2741070 RepID=A0ABZ2KU12_9BACT